MMIRTTVTPGSLRLLLVLSLLAWMGCGDGNPAVPRGVIAKGTIVRNGKPLEVPNREIGLGRVELRLISSTAPMGNSPDAQGDFESALAQVDGSFEFLGPGKGVAPGTYKLVVLQQDQGPQSDQLQGAFDRANTPIQVTIPQEMVGQTHDLGTIDLETYLRQADGS